jgi:hypothetical protein
MMAEEEEEEEEEDDDDEEYGAIGGMLGKGSRSTRRKPAPLLLSPQQIQHNLTRTRTRAASIGSRRLIAITTACPYVMKTRRRNNSTYFYVQH